MKAIQQCANAQIANLLQKNAEDNSFLQAEKSSLPVFFAEKITIRLYFFRKITKPFKMRFLCVIFVDFWEMQCYN